MRKLNIADASAPLAEFVKMTASEPVIVVRDGKPVAAVISLRGSDWESVSLAMNPVFQAIIKRSRSRHAAEGGFTSNEVRERLGIKPKRRRKAG